MPRVTVITPTWNRHDYLLRAMASVRQQTVPAFEHLVISDGPDRNLHALLKGRCRFIEMGRNWGGFYPNNAGGSPRSVGCLLARGDYIAYLDDDCVWLPRHLELLVRKIEDGYDFAFSRAAVIGADGTHLRTVGQPPPREGYIDTNILLHRFQTLRVSNWDSKGRPEDWRLVEAWMRAGLTWGHVPEVTVRYHLRAHGSHTRVWPHRRPHRAASPATSPGPGEIAAGHAAGRVDA